VFEHGGRWLHPLFALEDFLAGQPELKPATLVLRDKIVGRAAAFLMVGMGFRTVVADVLSSRARPILTSAGVVFEAGHEPDRIDCQTEDLLAVVTEQREARAILDERRRLSAGR